MNIKMMNIIYLCDAIIMQHQRTSQPVTDMHLSLYCHHKKINLSRSVGKRIMQDQRLSKKCTVYKNSLVFRRCVHDLTTHKRNIVYNL